MNGSPNPGHFIGFGDIHGPKPCEFIGVGDIHGPKPYKFIRCGSFLYVFFFALESVGDVSAREVRG